jgi:threonine aldolase
MENYIDLRSDTVTKPTALMREAMMRAEVGDDVFGEDPTVRELEERVAGILGKEAAIFVTSGTMANQLAIMTQTSRGDEIIVSQGAHCAWYETGAASALSGVQAVAIGEGGLFRAEQLQAAIKPAADWYPRSALVALEDTHNRGGGIVWPMDQLREVTALGRSKGLKVHLDGARLWNASVALGIEPSRIAQHVDTVSVCFSKGLGAPVGSALCGTKELVTKARRCRKMLGGGMRQAGILAAAGLYALANHRTRLAQDHENAKLVARELAQAASAKVDLATVQTNIVMVDTPQVEADRVAEEAKARGVLVSVFGPRRIRLVTHLDVASTAQQGARVVASVIEELRGRG